MAELEPEKLPEEAPALKEETLARVDGLLSFLSKKYRRSKALLEDIEEHRAAKAAQMGSVAPGATSPANAALASNPALTALMAGPSVGANPNAPLQAPGSLLNAPVNQGVGAQPSAVSSKLPQGTDATKLQPEPKPKTAAAGFDAFMTTKLAYQEYEQPPAKNEALGKGLVLGLSGYGGYELGSQMADFGSELEARFRMRELLNKLKATGGDGFWDRRKRLVELSTEAAKHDIPFQKMRFLAGKAPEAIGEDLVKQLGKNLSASRKIPLGLLGAGGMALGVNHMLNQPGEEEAMNAYY